jgi:hypothetical protein
VLTLQCIFPQTPPPSYTSYIPYIPYIPYHTLGPKQTLEELGDIANNNAIYAALFLSSTIGLLFR